MEVDELPEVDERILWRRRRQVKSKWKTWKGKKILLLIVHAWLEVACSSLLSCSRVEVERDGGGRKSSGRVSASCGLTSDTSLHTTALHQQATELHNYRVHHAISEATH